MQFYHYLEKIDVTLINFKKVFASVEVKFLNDCHDHGLIHNSKIDLRKSDTKRLLMHHVIHETCEEILNCSYKNKKVIIYRPLNCKDTFEIKEYCSIFYLNDILRPIINVIKKTLPIQIAELPTDISFHELKEKLNKGNGEMTEAIYKVLCNLTAINTSFENVKKFTKKHKLTFLSKEYFNKLKVKQIFL